jgi:hypothetical protein
VDAILAIMDDAEVEKEDLSLSEDRQQVLGSTT